MRKLLLSLVLASLLGGLSVAMTPEARKSFEAFERKADGGDPEAMYRMALLLERGFDTIPADTARSLGYLRQAAAADYAPAQNYLGYLFQEGDLLTADKDSALYWIRKAADAGDAKASYNVAHLLLEQNDSAALPYLSSSADAGFPAAITRMADLYAEGRALPADTLRAVELYNHALDKGFRDAELRLLNLMGRKWKFLSSEVALKDALAYWKKGAYTIASELLLQIGPEEAETPRAYTLLGHAYSRGLGLPYDHRKANEYFARAALMGDPSAQFILAETLEIFPDAVADILPDADGMQLVPSELKAQAAGAGVDSPETAMDRLLSPME